MDQFDVEWKITEDFKFCEFFNKIYFTSMMSSDINVLNNTFRKIVTSIKVI